MKSLLFDGEYSLNDNDFIIGLIRIARQEKSAEILANELLAMTKHDLQTLV